MMFRRFTRVAAVLLLSISAARGYQAPPDPAAQWMKQGTALMRAGKFAEAVAAFQQAGAASPQSPEAQLSLGMAQLRAGDADASTLSLKRAIELSPSARGAHMFLGIAAYQQNNLAAAAAALQAEVALGADARAQSAEALVWLGIVELAAEHPGQAANALDQAAALTPADPNVLYLDGKAHGLLAQKAYQALYKLDPDSAQVHRALAENFSASGEFEKAIGEYEAAIRKQPNNPDLYEALGEENQKMSRVEAATKAYEQELRLNPRSAIALYNLGKVDVETGKPELGATLLQQAVEAHATPGPTNFYLGLGLAETGKNEQAAAAFERSLQNNPSDFIRESAYYQLARVYQRLNRKDDAAHALAELKQLKARSAKTISDRN